MCNLSKYRLNKKWIVLCLLASIVCGLMGACKSQEKALSTEQKAVAEAEAKGETLKFTADEFMELFNSDKKMFSDKFNGRMFEIAGKVAMVSTSNYGFDRITVGNPEKMGESVFCDVNNGKEELVDIQRYDFITLRGVANISTLPNLEYCKIIEVKPREEMDYYKAQQVDPTTTPEFLAKQKEDIQKLISESNSKYEGLVVDIKVNKKPLKYKAYVSDKWYSLSLNDKMYFGQEFYAKLRNLSKKWYSDKGEVWFYDKKDVLVAKYDFYKGVVVMK